MNIRYFSAFLCMLNIFSLMSQCKMLFGDIGLVFNMCIPSNGVSG